MTYKENITAILECYFTGFKKEIIDSACNRILEVEPCEDKIIEWKKDFKEYINSLSMLNDDYKGIMEYIDELPVTPHPKVGHWIPVSERLPKHSGEFLVSVIDGSGEDNDYKAVGVAWFAHKKDYDIKESEWRELRIDETVIAWMPLPESYKP